VGRAALAFDPPADPEQRCKSLRRFDGRPVLRRQSPTFTAAGQVPEGHDRVRGEGRIAGSAKQQRGARFSLMLLLRFAAERLSVTLKRGKFQAPDKLMAMFKEVGRPV
jgi:hypothetical protein